MTDTRGLGVARRASMLLAFALLAGCAIEAGGRRAGDESAAGVTQAELVDGTPDADDTGVVFVASNVEACTGVLIAPNVVLTSRICVADAASGGPGEATFGTTAPAADYQVIADADATSPTHTRSVAEIRVPSDANDVYEGNVAVLLLDAPFASSEALPFVPRFEPSPQADEAMRVVGYGTTSASSSDYGTRRQVDGLHVGCVTSCGYDPPYDEHNWTAEVGTCIADAGSPALDAQDRIIGLAFAGANECAPPAVFSTITPWETFLVDAVVAGAELGCYEPPEWAGGTGTGTGGFGCGGSGTGGSGTGGSGTGASAAGGSSTGGSGATGTAAPSAAPTDEDDGGCSCRLGRGPRRSWALGAFAAALLVVRRRRRARAARRSR